jgi:adenosine deaminase
VACDAHLHLEATLRLRAVGAAAASAPPGRLLERSVVGCAADAARGGADAALVRFNPLTWLRRELSRQELVAALRRAADEAHALHGVSLGLFVTLKREASAAEVTTAVEVAEAAHPAPVLGVDVSRSYEVANPASRPGSEGDAAALRAGVARAREAGLEVAVHCGWYDGAAQLEEALELGAVRIGHAVPLRDPDHMTELASRGGRVEICPTSFERRGGGDIASLPLAEWHAAGIAIDVGTDHPLALGTTFARERALLAAALPELAPAAARAEAVARP